MKSARQIAVEALISVNDGKGYSNLVLDNALVKNELPPKEAAFASALIYGTIERLITLDFVIMKYSAVKIKKMSPAVREILRTAFYQIIYMDSVPQSAAVNEAVNLTKTMKVKSAGGFVNGVLRSFLRDGGKLPEIKGDKKKVMSVKYSCPVELIDLIISQYGEKTANAVLETSMGKQSLFCRVNTTKISQNDLIAKLKNDGVEAEADEKIENCVRLSQIGNLQRLSSYEKGEFHIQDKSSQTALNLLQAKEGDKVLDVCAAPGGKTFTLAEIMKNSGEIIACDIFPHKIKLIEDAAKRLGLTIINTKLNDGVQFNEDLGEFEKILCDVPCSGIGIMGRKPEIKYKDWTKLSELPEIQYKILETSSKYLVSGGVLMYSTCTLNKNENEAVIKKFLDNNSDFEPFEQSGHKEKWHTTLLPNEDDCDGFFVATIRKKQHKTEEI